MSRGNGKTQAAGRDETGRFRPGFSGNPAGGKRGPGSMSLVTAMLDEDDGKQRWALVRSLVERALAGEPAALKILWDRTDPATTKVDATVMPNGADEVLAALDRLKASAVNGKGKKR